MYTLFERNLTDDLLTERSREFDFDKIPSIPEHWQYLKMNGDVQGNGKDVMPEGGKVFLLRNGNFYHMNLYDNKNKLMLSSSHIDAKELNKMFPYGWDHLILPDFPWEEEQSGW